MTDNEKLVAQYQIAVVLNTVGLCGCGSGDSAWEIVKLVLERAETLAAAPVGVMPHLCSPAEDASARWVEFAAKACDGWGLLEHGVGISCAWLTDEGKLVLKILRGWGTDVDLWPEWWMDLTQPGQGRRLGKEPVIN